MEVEDFSLKENTNSNNIALDFRIASPKVDDAHLQNEIYQNQVISISTK
jgi:hypothetical protein